MAGTRLRPSCSVVRSGSHRWLSNESRSVLGLGVVIFAVLVVLVLSTLRFLQIVFDALDLVAFVGLFLVNWLGNGGALVPIPGARFAGLLLIFQQAVLLPSWEVFAVAGGAMALGLLSYYIAGARTAKSYSAGDSEGAQQLAAETGMLDDEQPDSLQVQDSTRTSSRPSRVSHLRHRGPPTIRPQTPSRGRVGHGCANASRPRSNGPRNGPSP